MNVRKVLYPLFAFVVVFSVHEFGHFFMAKLLGLHSTTFSIGIGPRIGKLFQWSGTEFIVSWLPIGAYVRTPGLLDADALTLFAISVAGVAANFIFTIPIVAWGFKRGIFQSIELAPASTPLVYALQIVLAVVKLTFKAAWLLLTSRSAGEIVGPIEIFKRLGALESFQMLLCQVALLSISIGAFNLLPIVPLDGGKLLFSFLSPLGVRYELLLIGQLWLFFGVWLLFYIRKKLAA